MRIKQTIISLSMLVAWNTLAASQEIPRFDPEAYCKEVSESSGSSSTIYNGCIQIEQKAYNAMRPLWSSIPQKTRSYCYDVAQGVGGSYSIFKGCMDMEMKAAASKEKFKF